MADFMKEMVEKDRARAAKPWYIRVPLNTMEFIWYRIILSVPDFPRKGRLLWQRVFRGYDDNDVYNINSFVIDKVHAPFKKYVTYQNEHGKSLPLEFAEDPQAWLIILNKMWYAIDDYWKTDHEDGYGISIMEMTEEKQKAHQARVDEGFLLFGKYLKDIWD